MDRIFLFSQRILLIFRVPIWTTIQESRKNPPQVLESEGFRIVRFSGKWVRFAFVDVEHDFDLRDA